MTSSERGPRRLARTTALTLSLALGAAALAACTSDSPGIGASTTGPTVTVPPTTPGGQSGSVELKPPVSPVGDVETIASGLDAPWSILRLGVDASGAAATDPAAASVGAGSTLISERDTARIVELTADGATRTAATIEGVVPSGEGGLLGLAHSGDAASGEWVYAYYTAASDNRIVRMPLTGTPGSLELGEQTVLVDGLAKAANHDGGRLAIGPDGKLYATVGDAGTPANAQDPDSLSGKILRMELDGSVPEDNASGTLVFTSGHRNPQGLAWDSAGRLWASEFGQDTWDELNLITEGANYGWPDVEGIADDDSYTDPLVQWKTDDASPSGLAIVSDTLFLASLKGARIWAVTPMGDRLSTESWFTGEFGRIRDAVPGPDGTLWFLSNNTDGRGSPTDGDDRLLQTRLGPLEEG